MGSWKEVGHLDIIINESPLPTLQTYEMFAINVSGLQTSLAVPPLLGAFYFVIGAMHLALDRAFPGPNTAGIQNQCRDWRFVSAVFGILAADLHLSAWLFSADDSFSHISLVLATVAGFNWFFFDRTKQGILLAAVCAIGAPVSELVLLRLIPLWSYPKADMDLGEWGSFVSWVPW